MPSLSHIKISGIASAVPINISRTSEYSILTVAEREKFAQMTGIKERRLADSHQCASDLCIRAAKELLCGLQWQPGDVELLIAITQTGDYPIPATSIIIQNKLGISKKCLAFDINLGCSGYPYGLATVGSLMKSLRLRKALLLAGDVSSRLCSYQDKAAWPLFGDAGTATALELTDDPDDNFIFDFNSDGAGAEAIIIHAGGLASREPINEGLLKPRDLGNGITRSEANLQLKGSDIFSFAIREVPRSLFTCLEKSGNSMGQVDYLILHQANQFINNNIIKKLGIPPEKALSSLEEYGNTSSASIPLTITRHADCFDKSRSILISGFGVGLSWASAYFKMPNGVFLNTVDSEDVYH